MDDGEDIRLISVPSDTEDPPNVDGEVERRMTNNDEVELDYESRLPKTNEDETMSTKMDEVEMMLTEMHEVESINVTTTTNEDTSEIVSVTELTPVTPSSPRVTPRIILSNVAYLTSQGLVTSNQIHNSAHLNLNILNLDTGLRTPVTPSTPSTPGTAGIVDKTGFRYNWDHSVNAPVLPVRCKNISGELHKAKLGSGGRGKCILVTEKWYTPNEFEAMSGRGSCKDWKRSIRYGGRTLHCLIDEGLLQPHAVSCTCSACCEDSTVSGPIRLFTPYKKRRKENDGRVTADELIGTSEPTSDRLSPTIKDCVVMLTPMATSMSSAPSFTICSPAVPTETIQLLNTDTPSVSTSATNVDVLTSTSQSQTPSSSSIDFAEQKQWWQLEEMVNTMINYGQQLKQLIEQAKQQSAMSREMALLQLRNQMEQEKREANILAQNNEIQQTDSKESNVKRCANCNRDASSDCATCGRVSYCSTFCLRNDWKNHFKDCTKQSNTTT